MGLSSAWGRDWGPRLDPDVVNAGVYHALREGWVRRTVLHGNLVLTAKGLEASRVIAIELGIADEIFGVEATPTNQTSAYAALALVCVNRPDWRE